MKTPLGALLVLLFGLIAFGCTSTQQYVCPDGKTVPDPSECAAGNVADTTEKVADTGTTEETTEVHEETEKELSDLCMSMQKSELEGHEPTVKEKECYMNKYMYPAATGEMNYDDCDEIIYPDGRAACYGFYSGYTDDKQGCSGFTGMERDFCLSSFGMSMAHNHEESVSAGLCSDIVDEGLRNDCLEEVLPYASCENDDNFCPQKCSYLSDNDCPVYSLGQKAVTDSGVEITLTGPLEERDCSTDSVYYVLSAVVKNSGTDSEYVFGNSFTLIDSDGVQHEVSSYIGGEDCQDADQFPGGELYPGSRYSGELWFESDDPLPAGEKKIIYDTAYSEGGGAVFVLD